MPLIPVQPTHPERVPLTLRVDRALYDELMAYAVFIDSSKDHIIAHALKHVFRHDREFHAWLKPRTDRPEETPLTSSNNGIDANAVEREVEPADAVALTTEESRSSGKRR